MQLNNISLRVKLTGGFFTVLALLGLISVIGFFALNGASTGFMEYRRMARTNNLSGQLQANMLMVRMSVKDFIITGSEKSEQEYESYYKKMETFLKEAHKEIIESGRAQKVDKIEELHIQYNDAFHEVIKLHRQNSQIVASVLNVRGPEGEKALSAIMTSAETDNNVLSAFHAGLALRHLLLARLYSQKYLASSEQADVDRVQQEFKSMQKELDTLAQELQNPERRKLLDEAIAVKGEYLDAFNAIVDITIKRNTLVNESLNKIGPEIATLLEEIKTGIKEVQDEIGPRLQASNSRAVSFIVIASIVAVMAGILLVFFITRSVLNQLGGDPAEIAEIAKKIARGDLRAHSDSEGKKSIGVYADMLQMANNL
ncbi:MAG: MCP four helix bundle domain-containing protein, partial [Desulfamplus sp.]|nr:MCP four helix bundle domain-containing protein [Desulfamplus sp.]